MHNFYKIKKNKTSMQNSLWHWDKYPELPVIPPYGEIEIGSFDGPGIIKTIHMTLYVDQQEYTDITDNIYLAIYFDNNMYPSVYCPVNSFFCDSFKEQSINFCTPVMAKRPNRSLFCYIPMPFREKAVIKLESKYQHTVDGYAYVTAEHVNKWDNDNAYFHATFLDKTIKITEGKVPLLETNGTGHFFGCHMTTETICPHFKRNEGICEGNTEFYIDRSVEPNCEYLGTEDYFGFSWTWNSTWYDDFSGTTFLDYKDGITKLACYRFMLNDPIRFENSLKAQINYKHEVNNPSLNQAKKDNTGFVDFKICSYWYQNSPVNVKND